MTEMFVSVLREVGATASLNDDGSITASGLTASQIGELAADRILTLHELTPLAATLEDAFMELTHDSVEFEATAYLGASR
jgi:ABC-2 type transport system ATP-binding protein